MLNNNRESKLSSLLRPTKRLKSAHNSK